MENDRQYDRITTLRVKFEFLQTENEVNTLEIVQLKEEKAKKEAEISEFTLKFNKLEGDLKEQQFHTTALSQELNDSHERIASLKQSLKAEITEKESAKRQLSESLVVVEQLKVDNLFTFSDHTRLKEKSYYES